MKKSFQLVALFAIMLLAEKNRKLLKKLKISLR